jgi:hypothetical protein
MSKKTQDTGVQAKNRTAGWALAISIVSALVSLTVGWFSALRPADVKVSLSSPEFQYQQNRNADEVVTLPGGINATRSKSILLLIGTCAFANNGANSGEITDIAVQFVSDDGTKWTFLPYRLLDGSSRITDQNGNTAFETAKAPRFSSVVLPGKQTAVHTYLFLADEFQDLAPHRFHVRLLTWASGEPKGREQQLATLDFNPTVIATLQTGGMTSVPFEEQRQRLKELN